jgi:hypothetical protein
MLAVCLICLPDCRCGEDDSAAHSPLAVAVSRTNYHGWPGSLALDNGIAEIVIVPEVGRIMRFGFVGEPGPFWENTALAGGAPNPKASEWGNFGGDKTWPAPQADWPKVTPRSWPPPTTFDSMPVEATVAGSVVTLASRVDEHYGIRAIRKVELDRTKPVMKVATTYEKLTGGPVKVGVWIITQLCDPVCVYIPLPAKSALPAPGYVRQSERLPQDFNIRDGAITLRRGSALSTKIGTDSDALLWVGERVLVLIESPRVAGCEYPDGGSSAEVYTNRDPLAYVELEMLGPLRALKVGDRLSQTNTYTLSRRTGSLETDVRQVLKK